MPKISYREYKPNEVSAAIIATADEICNEYMAQGFTLTLRQLYYQFVARGIIANKQTEYDRLGSLVNQARMAGMIDWEAIEDRTRNLEQLAHWSSPQQILNGVAEQFRYDRWEGQETRVEVWIEKEALAGVIEPICNQYRVPFFACRGYVSQSEQWRAAERFLDHIREGQRVTILHLGDHDPSGIDMSRDNADRITNFLEEVMREELGEYPRERFSLQRLALNMDQVRKYNPPPNPAKFTDSRATGYVKKYGGSSWELDALEPKVISALLEKHITANIDDKKWEEARAREQGARNGLVELAQNWKEK